MPALLNVFLSAAWLFAVPYIAMGLFGFKLIAPHAAAMKKAITAYVLVITVMGISTIFTLQTVPLKGAVLVMSGALVFMVSDIINAYNKFAREIPNERLYTMSTYMLGQFLLVQGIVFFWYMTTGIPFSDV